VTAEAATRHAAGVTGTQVRKAAATENERAATENERAATEVVTRLAQAAREATGSLFAAPDEALGASLSSMARRLHEAAAPLLMANEEDLRAARTAGMSGALLDRLRLGAQRLDAMSAAAVIAEDHDAVAQFLSSHTGTATFHNATPRLLDGFKLFSIPETGINIDRVPGPRGPVTFRDLHLRQLVIRPAMAPSPNE
jgi:gamma-glutamyl phosphate reductase